MRIRRVLITCFLVLTGGILSWAATIDSGLYTTYTTDSAKTTLSWVECGSLSGSEGCYGSGSLGPFGHMGSMVESAKVYDNREGTVTRFLYVVDSAYGSGQSGVALNVYQRVDTIAGSFVTTTFTLKKTLSLSLTGGNQAVIYMAANKGYLVIGSSNSTEALQVNKRNLAVTPLGIISGAPFSITADNYGYITVTSLSGFFVIGPSGSLQEDGGGSPFMINALIGTQP